MVLVHKVLHKTLRKVHHKNQKFIIQNKKNETDDNEKEINNLTINKIEECDVTFILEGNDYRKKILYLS